MFNTKPDNLRDELRAGIDHRDHFLSTDEQLRLRFQTRYYRSDQKPDRAITVNHAYEYLSIMNPSLCYTNPRVKVTAADPNLSDEGEIPTTMGERAISMGAGLNHWSRTDKLGVILDELLMDFQFCWAVAMPTVEDQPGTSGQDEFVPVKPVVMRVAQENFILDPVATTWRVLANGGPRYSSHQWKADFEDLMEDPAYDNDTLADLASDTDLEEFDPERKGGLEVPKRGEVIAWDVWIPEIDVRKEGKGEETMLDNPAYNGSIWVIALNNTPEGVGKKPWVIRKPRPAYCPPWGPYVVGGYMKVRNSPYPMSPLVATAEQAEETNSHTTAAAEDAANSKSFTYSEKGNPRDGNTIRDIKHGSHALLDDAKTLGSAEVGGVTESRYRYIGSSQERLNRTSGLSDSMRGQPGDATATAESIADKGTNIRTDGLKGKFRWFVTDIFTSAAYYAHYGDDIVLKTGEDGQRLGLSAEFRGGIGPGQERFNFFDLSLDIEPYSLGHTDAAMLQKRVGDVFGLLAEIAPVMKEAPYIKWKLPFKTLFEVYDMEDADEWIDEEILAQAQAATQMKLLAEADALANPPAPQGAPGAPGGDPQGGNGEMPVQEQPPMQETRSNAADLTDAYAE